ncbi:hypothetical protein U14_01291 [Candidatus Moduliflexus flocculans]|uniref:SHOCT domain-containing protein n=1 Tax=Candidatus Moduliflexus flocculans TaxID=1499966 RepID=A0A0S6VX59_9BACT|nr:hypothetical protein U14_01291 [Candidatus Moduliflexus flocculans]
MYSRERAERIIVEAMRKALQIGYKSINLGNAHIGINSGQGGVWAGLFKRTPVNLEMFDEGALKTTQLNMLQDLFRRYGVDASPAEVNAMLSALIGNGLERYAKAFLKSIPFLDSLIYDEADSLPVLAAASTYALGQIAVLRLEMEQPFGKLNLQAVKQTFQREFEHGKTLSRAIKEGQSSSTIVLDFETARKRYEHACQQPNPIEDDPFAISIEEMSPRSASKHAPSPKKPDGLAEKFEQLATLREKGILTEEEFQAQRQKLLNQL